MSQSLMSLTIRMRWLVACAVIYGPGVTAASAQTFVQSADGETAFVLNQGGVIAINFADKQIKAGGTSIVSNRPLRLGFEVTGKAKEGALMLTDSEGKLSLPETSASVFGGLYWSPGAGSDGFGPITQLWLFAQLEGVHGSYTLTDTLAAVPETVKQRFDGRTVKAYLDLKLSIQLHDIYVGLSYGQSRRNNIDDLKEVNVCRTIRSSGVNSAQACTTAHAGDYVVDSATLWGTGVLWYLRWLRNRIAMAGFANYDGAREDTLAPGVGLFFSEKGAPLNILGGVTLEWRDGKERWGLQVGLPFGPSN